MGDTATRSVAEWPTATLGSATPRARGADKAQNSGPEQRHGGGFRHVGAATRVGIGARIAVELKFWVEIGEESCGSMKNVTRN